MKHYTVLKNECIDGLAIKKDGIYVDATLGYAGDSEEILRRIKRGMLFAFDKDLDAVTYSLDHLKKVGDRFVIFHSDYINMKEMLASKGIEKVDGILFDLGVSSVQIDEDRGFSFMRDEKLDMRMDQSQEFDAIKLLNSYSYDELRKIFFQYGEVSKANCIAKKIVDERLKEKIVGTQQLCDIIKMAVGAKEFYKSHPERQVFQAIRIEVNNELENLKKALEDALTLLNEHGRLVVVTFHSLEDKIVKQFMKKYSEVDPIVKGLPSIPYEYRPKLKIITKKAIKPSDEELRENSRSRSAKLRIAERI